jgi:hypothetical protein
MRLDIDSTARSPLFKTFTRSVCFGCTAAMILALVNTAVPVVGLRPNGMLTYQILTGLYLTVGGVLAILIFQLWGDSSCLADLAIWLTAFFALIGSVLIQRVLCAALIPAQSAVRVTRMSLVCDPSYQQTVAYGSALAIVIITMAIWGAIRYLERRARKGR